MKHFSFLRFRSWRFFYSIFLKWWRRVQELFSKAWYFYSYLKSSWFSFCKVLCFLWKNYFLLLLITSEFLFFGFIESVSDDSSPSMTPIFFVGARGGVIKIIFRGVWFTHMILKDKFGFDDDYIFKLKG